MRSSEVLVREPERTGEDDEYEKPGGRVKLGTGPKCKAKAKCIDDATEGQDPAIAAELIIAKGERRPRHDFGREGCEKG